MNSRAARCSGRLRSMGISLSVMVVALGAVAGCSETTASNGSSAMGEVGATGAGPNVNARADTTYAAAQITKYSAVPTFTAPGPPIDAQKLRGKTIFNFPDSSANPYAANIADGEKEAAAQFPGLNYVNCTAQGQLSQWVQCMDNAMARKVDLIFNFSGVNPKSLGPQIAAARRAKIPVMGTGVYDVSQAPTEVDSSVPNDYGLAGQLMADWVILDTHGKANALIITSNEVPATTPIVEAIKKEFSTRCGGCTPTYVNVPVADWGTKIQSEVQSALIRDPNINYIVPIYDSMTQFVLPAITGTGKTGSVHIATYNGTPFVLKEMQDRDVVRMNVGVDERWLGWAYVDAAARVLAGAAADKTINEHTAVRVFTRANVSEAGIPPKVSTGYGDAYVDGYRKLWGVG